MYQELLHLTCLPKITVIAPHLKIQSCNQVMCQLSFHRRVKRKLKQRTVTWITEHDKYVLQDYTGFDFHCFLNRPSLD